MNKILNAVGAFFAAPFKAAVNFVDQRPNASQIKEHLQRHQATTAEKDDALVAGLQLRGTEKVIMLPNIQAFMASTPGEKAAFQQGLSDGHKLAVHAAVTLTRREFHRDSKLLREVEKEQAQERQQQQPQQQPDLQEATA